MAVPFLWRYIEESVATKIQSGGQERPLTGSLAEESRNNIIDLDTK